MSTRWLAKKRKRIKVTLLVHQPPVFHNCSISKTTKTNQIRPNVFPCHNCLAGAKQLLPERNVFLKNTTGKYASLHGRQQSGPSPSLIPALICCLSLSICLFARQRDGTLQMSKHASYSHAFGPSMFLFAFLFSVWHFSDFYFN